MPKLRKLVYFSSYITGHVIAKAVFTTVDFVQETVEDCRRFVYVGGKVWDKAARGEYGTDAVDIAVNANLDAELFEMEYHNR